MTERQTTQRPAESQPASAPGAPATRLALGAVGPRAGFFRRLAALIIDGVVLGLIYVALGALLQQGLVVLTVVNIIVDLAYFALLEGGLRGQTLGKRAVGIRVVDSGIAERIGYGRAALRYFGRYLSSLPLGLGYLWMVIDREKQTWHDKLASTVVVPAAVYPFAADAHDGSVSTTNATQR